MTTAEQLDTVVIPAAEYEALRELAATVSQLERDNKRLSDQLAVLLNRVFGRSSERLDPHQLRLFAEELSGAEAPAGVEIRKPVSRTRGAGHGRAHFPEHLPREEIVLDLPQDQRTCADCASEMKPFGEDVTERGHLVPAKLIIKRYVRKKYACPEGHGVVSAPLPASLIDKAKYEPSVYAHITTAKYGDHLPLHRLAGIFKRHGLSIPKSTMWEMLRRVDEIVAQPILAQMRRELLEGSHIQADETPVTVRLEDQRGTRPGYIWTYGDGCRRLFEFTMTRQRDGPMRFLGTWKGTLQTDGYSGYDAVTRRNGLVRAGCWSHARRKIKEAVETGATSALPLLVAVQRLFAIERALRTRRDRLELESEAFHRLRAEVRTRRNTCVLRGIRAEVERLWGLRATLPKSALGKALTYLDNQWKPLTRIEHDGVLELHNNDAERALRHVVTGRKNWLFFGSPRGGEVGARLFSLVATCKGLDINPEAYLQDVIGRVATTPASQVAQLTPWAWAEAREADAKS